MMRTATSPLLRLVLWFAPLALTLAACDSNNPTTHALTVSTTTRPESPGGATGGSISFSAAQVVLREVELAVAGTPCAAETERGDAARMGGDGHEGDDERDHDGDDEGEHDGDDEGCEELELGPVTVNLPLDATTKVILDALVPAGTYTGVEAKLDAVTVSGVFTDVAGMAHPFTFTSRSGAEIEIEFPTPITVGPTSTNVTITVDVASWFKNADGAVLDPAAPANLGTISRNIRRSFRAFGDDDHDGHDDDRDHEDGHGGHGPG
jgi:hypothetical protein